MRGRVHLHISLVGCCATMDLEGSGFYGTKKVANEESADVRPQNDLGIVLDSEDGVSI